MRKFRFFISEKSVKPGDLVRISGQENLHLKKSLRLEVGNLIFVFNEEGEYKAILELITDEYSQAQVIEKVEHEAVDIDKTTVNLYLALIKPSNFELALEKVTELGVDNIIPISTDFSQIKADKIQGKYSRWEKIIISACKQSERIGIPKIHHAISFQQAVKNVKEDVVNLFLSTSFKDQQKDPLLLRGSACRQAGDKGELYSDLFDISNQKTSTYNLFIGPEGGFSPKEEELAKSLDFKFIKINENILRSETAAIVGVGILKSIISSQ